MGADNLGGMETLVGFIDIYSTALLSLGSPCYTELFPHGFPQLEGPQEGEA